MTQRFAQLLQPGARVAVVAPSGPFEKEPFEKGLEVLRSRYSPQVGAHAFDASRYLAGSDETRLADLHQALNDTSIEAVFCARGGYGAMRLLAGLTWPERPKPIIGFSDITALHAAATRQGWRTLHAPVITQLGKQSATVVDRLWALLEGRAVAPLTGSDTIHDGVAEGPLLGGNLSVIAALSGTSTLPSFRGAVLLLEDIGERPYRLDRMWTQLALSGVFTGIAGLALGEFTSCEEPKADYSSAQVLAELASKLGVPCVSGFHIGHGAVNEPVVLGARVRLDSTAKTLTSLEGLGA